jgi:formate-dependent nitrite reductase membrane component NrfD
MSFDNLAQGATAEALGLVADDAFWLAIILIVLSLAIALLLVKSVRDRQVLEMQPVIGATYALVAIALLCFVGGILIMFH